nr:CREB/ATF bZIP transcription factor [Zootoca vivipara]
MRHSLAQLLASSSACPSPSKAPLPARSGSRAEAGDEAPQPRREDSDDSSSLEEVGGGELLFPAGLELELDDWLEAAVVATENRPGWLASPERACAETEEEEEQPKQQQRPQQQQQGRRPARPAGSSRLKAAAAARLNRQRKKQYVMGLESRLQGLAAENRGLRDRNRGLCRRLRDLERETSYLRAVLANQSALGRLLSRLAGDGRVGLRISSSGLFEDGAAAVLEARPAYEASGDHDYALPVVPEGGERKRAASPSAGGICLHVDRDQVSVEFCSACARRAAVGSALAAAASPPSTADSYSYSSTLASKIFSFRWLPCQAPLCRG